MPGIERANTRAKVADALEGLIDTPLIDIWFLTSKGWIDEKHADNPDTLKLTIDMTLERIKARYALWDAGPPETSRWCLYRWVKYPLSEGGGVTTTTRHYPNREAAEMIAIHGA